MKEEKIVLIRATKCDICGVSRNVETAPDCPVCEGIRIQAEKIWRLYMVTE